MATFVLVHGAWHGGWCWRKVSPLLRAEGHEVYTPTLTGLGERVHLASPTTDLTTHIQDIVNLLEYEDLRGVVLVGHSYAGMVITGVAHRAADRLAHLVFLDAAVPGDGQTLFDIIDLALRQQVEARVLAEGDGWRLMSHLPIPWEAFVREEYGVTDEADVEWMVARMCPQPIKTFTEPVRWRNPAALALARTRIRCIGDPPARVVSGEAEEARQPDSGWRYREIATRHDAMVTAPREVADLLLGAIET